MKSQFLTFEQKLTILLRFGTLSGAADLQTYYFTPNEGALDAFGYKEEEKDHYAPFWGESLDKVVGQAFAALVETHLKNYNNNPF